MLLVGPTGTGKTITAQTLLLSGLDPEAFAAPNLIVFSAQTSAAMTQVSTAAH